MLFPSFSSPFWSSDWMPIATPLLRNICNSPTDTPTPTWRKSPFPISLLHNKRETNTSKKKSTKHYVRKNIKTTQKLSLPKY